MSWGLCGSAAFRCMPVLYICCFKRRSTSSLAAKLALYDTKDMAMELVKAQACWPTELNLELRVEASMSTVEDHTMHAWFNRLFCMKRAGVGCHRRHAPGVVGRSWSVQTIPESLVFLLVHHATNSSAGTQADAPLARALCFATHAPQSICGTA